MKQDKNRDENQPEDAFNRRFKYAVVAFAIIEAIVIALIVYKTSR